MKKNMAIFSTIAMLALLPSFGYASAKVGQVQGKPSVIRQQSQVNINTANLAKFQTIKGLGEKKAQAIITYRESHGSFKSVDDLAKVPGIGDKMLAKLKSQLTTG